ncbi:MAG: hypothetical protein V4437_03200 [Patescibacteria group bacterium]
MQDATNNGTVKESLLGRLGASIVAGLTLLIPIFFIPNAVFPFQFSKIALALAGVVVVWLFFSIQTLRKGAISFTWSRFILALLLLPVAYFVAAVFSPVPAISFFGYQLGQDTFGFIALAVALSIATVLAIKTEKQLLSALFGFLIAGWVVLVFQSIQIFFGHPILSTLFTSSVVNTVGSWSDFALFVALLASLILLALEALTLSMVAVVVLSVTLAVSLLLLAIANFALAWFLLGGVAFVMLVLTFVRRRGTLPGLAFRASGIAACLALVVAIFFAFFGSGLSTALQNNFHIQSLEVRPSMQGTLGVLQYVYAKNAIFGSGPGTFADQWLLSRPAQILATPFWNVGFNSGFGAIPTALVTGGIVVGLAWLVFILWFLYTAARALLTVPAHSDRSYFLVAATSLASLFLIIASVFYVPSAGLTLLLFVFIGLFIASLKGTALARPVRVVFSESPRLGFLAVLVVAVTLVLSLVSLYGAGEVYASALSEGNALVRSNAGNIEGATASLTAASALSPQDRYYRMLTTLSLARLNVLVQKGGSDKKTQDEFQTILSEAVTESQNAVNANPASFDNWMSRASVYEAVVPLAIPGAYEKAVEALGEAGKRNPGTPEVDYHLANLKAFNKDLSGARTFALAALQKKADYTPAILLLAQLSLNEGKLDDAITAVKAAIVFTPQDSSLLYQLGLLQLEAKHYQDAADSFGSALTITPDFANASFFLGQADVFLGKGDAALLLFKELQTKNVDNATLKSVIDALEKGQNPFVKGTVAPGEQTPAGV